MQRNLAKEHGDIAYRHEETRKNFERLYVQYSHMSRNSFECVKLSRESYLKNLITYTVLVSDR
jgi:hypothetical protein